MMQAMHFIEQAYPTARFWTLDTPRWNQRTPHFYEKMGFVRVGEDGHEGSLYLYEKRIPTPEEGSRSR